MHIRTITFTLIAFLFSNFLIGNLFAAKYDVKKYCKDPNYTCIKVKRGQSWNSLFKEPEQREIVRKLNRTNHGLWAGQTIAVPKDITGKDLLDFAPFPRSIDATGQRTIMVEPNDFAWGAYDEHGHLVHWGPMSGGKKWCADIRKGCKTITGEFEVYRKGSAWCKSSKYPVGKGGAPMPYCMFFKGGYAMHASTSVPGYHASHGCVRIYKNDARWLNKNFVLMPEDGGTSVIVNSY